MDAIELGAGLVLAALVLFDVFQAVVVPRPITTPIGIARYVVRLTWGGWRDTFSGVTAADKRERYLGVYAPAILIFLLALWIVGLVAGYGLVLHALREQLDPRPPDVWAALYFAGTSLLTIGFGDIAPVGPGARLVALVAGASGLILVALAITFLFSLYTTFQRREQLVVTLDERAGAPPSGVRLLETSARLGMLDDLPRLFAAWELWSAEVLDSHLAYPLLGFFRSSHDNESWVSALGALLDAATLCVTTVEGVTDGQARMLLGLGTHLVEDVTRFFAMPHEHETLVERSEFDAARAELAGAGLRLRDANESWAAFTKLRARYASDLNSMAAFWAVPPAQWIGDRSTMRHVLGASAGQPMARP